MLFLTLILGIVLNMIGYIPPGNINLTVVQITITRGIRQALYFIGAFSTIEVLFTFGVMRFVQWLSSEIDIGNAIDVIIILLFGFLGIMTWRSRKEMPKADYSKKDSIRYGMLLGVVNPMQIPFWLFFGTYIISHKWINTGYLSLTVFSIGSGLGAALALYGFARFAQYIQEKFELSSYIVNKGIALLFFALSGYHICKLIYIYYIK